MAKPQPVQPEPVASSAKNAARKHALQAGRKRAQLHRLSRYQLFREASTARRTARRAVEIKLTSAMEANRG